MVALCILDISGGEVSEWHTTPCAVRVLSTIHTDDSDEGDDTITPTVKERVAVLESMIQRVASGAPIVVTSTSAMTDTAQIYVLSSDGKWYYHNGSTWVAGGEYGAVSTDTSLTQSGMPADAKTVGNALNYKFVQGNMYSPFSYNAEANRIRLYGVADLGFGVVTVTPKTDTNISVKIFDDDYQAAGGTGAWRATSYTFNATPNKSKFCVTVRKADDSALTPAAEYLPEISIESIDNDMIRDRLIHQNAKLCASNLKGSWASSNFTSDYIFCKEGDNVKCSNFSAAGNRNILAVYDKYLSLIDSIASQGQSTVVPFDYTFPAGSAFFTVTCFTQLNGTAPAMDFKYTVKNDPYEKMEEYEQAFEKGVNYEIVPVNTIAFRNASFSYTAPGSWWGSTTVVSGVIDCSRYCRLEVISKTGQHLLLVAPASSASKYVYGSFAIKADTMYIQVVRSDNQTITIDEVADDVVITGYLKTAFDKAKTSVDNAVGLSVDSMMARGGRSLFASGVILNSTSFFASDFLPCVPGDKVIVSGGIATSWTWLATFDKDGRLLTAKQGNGVVDTYDLSHTFADSEVYFVISVPSTKQHFVKYVSQFSPELTPGLPAPYKNEMDAVSDRIAQKIASISQSVPLVFGFSTDQHFSPRALIYEGTKFGAYALSEIAQQQPIDAIILGGDITSYHDSYTVKTILEDVDKFTSYFSGSGVPVISISGNHDSFQNNENVTPQNMFNSHFKKAVDLHRLTKYHNLGTNGYIDYDFNETRMIFVDTHPRKDMTSALCSAWLQDAFDTLPAGWTAIVVGHIPALTSLPTPPFYNAVSTYQSVILANKDKIDFLLFGHSHRDAVYVSDEGINVIATTCALSEGHYDSKAYTAKVTAFDVFVYDKGNHVVHGVRYGNGYDRTIKLTGDVVTVSYNLTNATTLNNATMRLREGDSFDDLLVGVTGTVSVTMGGVDITADAYADDKVSIASLTDNVVITES